MKRRTVLVAMTVAAVATMNFFIIGCSKEDEESRVFQEAAKDEAAADILFSDVFNQVNLAAGQLENDLWGPGANRSEDDGGCATVTISPWDTVNWPKTITVDFGETYCQGADGVYRKGKIQAVITGRYRDSLTVLTITPEEFFVNEYKVEGAKTVTNLGHVTDGHMTFGIIVDDAVITRPGGKQFQWESARTRVWLEGEGTAWPIVMDDVFEISGEASGTTYEGVGFLIATTEPLRIERDCEWIVSGALELTPEGYSTRILDYGDGNCDDKATVTVNGVTYNITLP
jgi:hypothetical protein